ncbi:hypothetical protein OQA88_10504 [Cercophora sp. LCS_1]
MAAVVVRALAAGWLFANAAAAVHERFQAMETSPALSPRFYKAAPARPLLRRQSQCNSGSHPCNEIGQVGICASSSRCLTTQTPSTSSSPLVTQVPTGCTTSQVSCAASLGGGCCALTQSCTLITGRAHCAEITTTPTASGVAKAEEQEELSAGVKAGIGVGIVFGCGLIIGAATWWCLRRRKTRRQSMSTHRPRPQGVIGAVLGGGRDTTDDNSEMVSHGGQMPGVTQDYFGPDPVIGPYSGFHSPSGGTTPGVDRDRGGVPLIPHGPGDIAVPVEIDSSTPKLPDEPVSYTGSRVSIPPPAPPPIPPPSHDMTGGVFELYGSDFLGANMGAPSPVTPLAPSPLEETPPSEAGNQPRSPRHR